MSSLFRSRRDRDYEQIHNDATHVSVHACYCFQSRAPTSAALVALVAPHVLQSAACMLQHQHQRQPCHRRSREQERQLSRSHHQQQQQQQQQQEQQQTQSQQQHDPEPSSRRWPSLFRRRTAPPPAVQTKTPAVQAKTPARLEVVRPGRDKKRAAGARLVLRPWRYLAGDRSSGKSKHSVATSSCGDDSDPKKPQRAVSARQESARESTKSEQRGSTTSASTSVLLSGEMALQLAHLAGFARIC